MTPRLHNAPRARSAVMASVALHAALVLGAWRMASSAEPPPKQVRVYRVDIVSPAPNVLGEPLAEPPAPAEPGPAPAAAPEPTPPAPEPKPEPEAPAPRPEPPAETPKQAPPREQPKARPPEPARTPPREAARPAQTPPRRETPAERPKGRETGSGSAETRSAGTGTRPGPATGRNPEASSPGGEGLNVRTRGVACPENYCNNVVRQVRRFFRAPEGTQGASGNVCFTLFRDGSVDDDVAVERQRGGGFQFRLALIEAVEQAGVQKAFGALPRGFEAESIQLCVLMSPATT